ncbi:hypothetical protein [Saccharothrix algeriensis]|uniref:Uncharacterized protein n=1 Tax=Saccharothrix algeriensis TaxID=173560 RepID=A0A8T8HYE1_9PSEU|nr:hypothetical protein [Saccharothrix algeriensis]MBM7815194.1 hypothetical protein [Saccharothrix algeriensis]QTR03431.1 hypothetical protein J7S33_31790 [Saccharothrix algeriensis]
MKELDEFEDALVERFREHPVLAAVDDLPERDFHAVLLQRRFLSHAFTSAYDLAIDLLTDEEAVEIARVIIREEYPRDKGDALTPSHREDMKNDLLALGVPWERFVASRPTEATERTNKDTWSLILDAGAAPNANLGLVTILRFWGEVLVSAEYGRMWPRIQRRLVVGGENRSLFYYPHYEHDAKTSPLADASVLSLTHSDQLGVRLAQLADSEAAWETFKRVETEVLNLKTRFYDQFLPMVA